MTTDNRDATIRRALEPARDVLAPLDLGDTIYRAILVTPQRRALVSLGRLGSVPRPPRWLVAVVLVLLLAAAVVIGALSRMQVGPVLSTYHGGPDRTGVMPGPGPAGAPMIEWNVARPGAIAFNTMPLPADGRIIVGDDSGMLAALDETTGETLWEQSLDSPIRGAPALIDGLVVVGSEAGEVVAVDAATGRTVWRQQLGSGAVAASLLAAGHVVYAGTDGGRLVALDPKTGAVGWSVDVGGAVTRGAAYRDGVLYVGATGGRFSAIDAASHAPLWQVELGAGNVGTPTVGDGFVYVGRGLLALDGPHDLVALRTADGTLAWSFASPAGNQVHVGALADGRVYAAAEDGYLSALDAATGRLIWTTSVDTRLVNPVAIVGGVLYVSAEPHTLFAIDARTSAELWSVRLLGNGSSPSVVDGRVFVGTDLGRVVAIAGSSSITK